MSFPRLAITRPVATVMVLAALMVLGGISLTRLPVDLLPDLAPPVVVCLAQYPGAAPEEVEQLVTVPLEEAAATVANVRRVDSETAEGLAVVIAEFSWGTDMDFAALEVREKVGQVAPYLPDEVMSPSVIKVSPSMLPILTLTLSGPKDMASLTQLAIDTIQPRLERIEGVAVVNTLGGSRREAQVLADTAALQEAGLGLRSLRDVIRAQNINLPAGSLVNAGQDLSVRAMGEFESLDQLAGLPVPGRDNSLMRLCDLAWVGIAPSEQTSVSEVDGSPAVAVSVRKATDANTVEVARKIKAELAQLQEELPPGVQLQVVSDQSEFIERSVAGLVRDGVLGGVLAVLILFLFMGEIASVVVVATAIPIGIITSLILIYFAGLSLNIMTLGGLALTVGILVDNAIVVLENIHRKREEGMDQVTASLEGSHEVTNAVTAGTLTTVSVFLPVVFVAGMASYIFRELSLTVSFSLLTSLVMALTVIPLWTSRVRIGTRRRERKEGVVSRLTERVSYLFRRVSERYQAVLRVVIRRRGRAVVLALVMVSVTGVLVARTGGDFMPSTDQGKARVRVTCRQGTPLEETVRKARAVCEQLRQEPEVASIFLVAGPGEGSLLSVGDLGEHEAALTVRLVERAERSRSTSDLLDPLKRRAMAVPGIEAQVEEVSGMFGLEGYLGAPIVVSVRGDDLRRLNELADQAYRLISGTPGVTEVRREETAGQPELMLRVDRSAALARGLTAAEVADELAIAVEGKTAGRLHHTMFGDLDIRLRLSPDCRTSPHDLRLLPLSTRGAAAGQVFLDDVATWTLARGPQRITRESQSPAVRLEVMSSETDLTSLMEAVQTSLSQLSLPPGYEVTYGGEYREMSETFSTMGLALVLAVVLVYMVLAGQFESFFHPFTIMFTVPLAFAGGVLALLAAGMTLNVISLIATIMLAGIAVNNTIVLIDFAERERARGKSAEESVLSAAVTRLRPILMTALTTILGLLPVAVATGEGSDIYRALGVVLVAGLALSTLATLFILPAFYCIMEDLRAWWLARRGLASSG